MLTALLAGLAAVIAFGFFVMDMVILRIKGEAVARGQAHVVAGEWGWNDD